MCSTFNYSDTSSLEDCISDFLRKLDVKSISYMACPYQTWTAFPICLCSAVHQGQSQSGRLCTRVFQQASGPSIHHVCENACVRVSVQCCPSESLSVYSKHASAVACQAYAWATLCVCVCAVLSIRGTLSLEDCVTDFMCEPVDLDDWIKEVDNAATPRSFSDRIPEVKAASKPSHSLNHSTHGCA